MNAAGAGLAGFVAPAVTSSHRQSMAQLIDYVAAASFDANRSVLQQCCGVP